MSRADDARRVWSAWARRQKMPDACKYTADREKLISKRLALGYTAEDLELLIRYAWESDDDRPTFWRGEHDGAGPRPKTYLDLTNLLVEEKLGARVQAAREWLAAMTQGAAADTGVVLRFPARPGRPGSGSGGSLVTLEGPARWRR